MTGVTPRSRPKQRGLGPAWTALIGAGVAQAVGRGHLAATPCMGEFVLVLRGHQRGVGGHQRLGADEVLLHPAQPRAAQCGHVEADERLEASVGGAGWSTAQTLVAMSAARAPPSLAWVNRSAKPVRACTSRTSSGRSSRGRRASTAARSAIRLSGSSNLSSGSTERSGPPGVETIVTDGLVDARSAVSRQARSRRADRRPSSSSAEAATPQRAAHRRARGLPRGAGEKTLPGIGVAKRAHWEHVAAADRAP